MAAPDSPLLRMTQQTPTDYWNDSCSVEELEYAIARGAVGATTNPTIVLDVLNRERIAWAARIRDLAAANPCWTEVELAWAVVEEMAVRGAATLAPTFGRHAGRKGRLSLQTNPADHTDASRMVAQATRFASLAPNIQVKFPVTPAGLEGIEEATARGVTITGTVSFTVAQAVAVGEAVERGLRRHEHDGGDPAAMAPVCALMIGRLDDWMKVVIERDGLAVHPDAPNWAGIAVFKRAYSIYRERGYRTRLLAAAYRHRLHWTELVGADAALTIPHEWQVRFNASGIEPSPRIDVPVASALVDDLIARIPDFARAYEPDGLSVAEFTTFGPTVRTLRGFIKAYHDLIGAVRDVVLPNPDVRAA